MLSCMAPLLCTEFGRVASGDVALLVILKNRMFGPGLAPMLVDDEVGGDGDGLHVTHPLVLVLVVAVTTIIFLLEAFVLILVALQFLFLA